MIHGSFSDRFKGGSLAAPAAVLAWTLLVAVATSGCDAANRAPVVEPGSGESRETTRAAAAAAQPPGQSLENAAGPAAAPVGEASALGTPTAGIVSSPSSRDGAGNAILREVRVGERAGADRIVFEFEDSGLPAWRVEYVDQPVRDCGSGDPVPVAGDGWLEVSFTGAQAHTDAGAATTGPRRRPVDQQVVLELVRTCDFEGQVTWVAGVSSPNRFTPHVLSNPSRLVIDVSH